MKNVIGHYFPHQSSAIIHYSSFYGILERIDIDIFYSLFKKEMRIHFLTNMIGYSRKIIYIKLFTE